MSSHSAPTHTAPWLGRRWEQHQAAIAGFGSLLLCTAYWGAVRQWTPDATPGAIEFAGTMTSLWSVWITQRRNVLALPIGIVSVVLMGKFFLELGLMGQMLLHWAYNLSGSVLGLGTVDTRRGTLN